MKKSKKFFCENLNFEIFVEFFLFFTEKTKFTPETDKIWNLHTFHHYIL